VRSRRNEGITKRYRDLIKRAERQLETPVQTRQDDQLVGKTKRASSPHRPGEGRIGQLPSNVTERGGRGGDGRKYGDWRRNRLMRGIRDVPGGEVLKDHKSDLD